ncbi:carbohydrate ABC transporter permease [Brachybacterium sp. p3-SID957]|uniref:carbohydrate ABC transporter permease n=1 Tax=Brachybacterium sp. p3-SID957 TaxID=2916049 RepID=UPI00223ADF09|nr:ABC transporter permease subunit [Brachybacterium sp. p3-SID957]MCT1776979.1 ABC transporter permease subunit [Brachybacterium sp. p3-SID957]
MTTASTDGAPQGNGGSAHADGSAHDHSSAGGQRGVRGPARRSARGQRSAGGQRSAHAQRSAGGQRSAHAQRSARGQRSAHAQRGSRGQRSARDQRSSRGLHGRRLLHHLATYAVLLVAALLTLAPFLVSVMTAFTSRQQFAQQGPLAAPDPPVLDNFVRLFTDPDGFVTPVAVTVQMVAVILAGQMVFSVLAAYAFAHVRFPGRDMLFWVYVATLMVPQVVVVVPLYLMMSEMGLRDTFWALVLPFVLGSPYAIFLLRENFRSVPSELMDAMRIDGAGTGRLLWNLVVPLNRPIIVTLVLITVVTHWNNFMWPMVITSGPTWRVITVATSALQSQYNNNWTLVMAGTTLAMLPLVILMVVFQKQITRSVGETTLR